MLDNTFSEKHLLKNKFNFQLLFKQNCWWLITEILGSECSYASEHFLIFISNGQINFCTVLETINWKDKSTYQWVDKPWEKKGNFVEMFLWIHSYCKRHFKWQITKLNHSLYMTLETCHILQQTNYNIEFFLFYFRNKSLVNVKTLQNK